MLDLTVAGPDAGVVEQEQPGVATLVVVPCGPHRHDGFARDPDLQVGEDRHRRIRGAELPDVDLPVADRPPDRPPHRVDVAPHEGADLVGRDAIRGSPVPEQVDQVVGAADLEGGIHRRRLV